MKLVKLLPTFAAAAILTACSTVSDVASSTANIEGNAGSTAVDSTTAAKNITTGSKTVTYTCSVNGKTNQPVSAVYTFNNGEPSTATVTINKKVVGENLKVDASYQDGVKFVSGTNVWSLDIGFSAKTAETTVPVMFTANNQILAKNCVVTK
ncbi:Holliday junction resolvase [Glaesserella parasuis]|uniref:Holliday junction resolvase n=1 Tax=Glaesserella parasuis TaxID=738 RepID=UPI00243689AF|nr:Holliday junction resolvase [Glaesserella parasuis]MDG6309423.1 Holliday junction resolvase [Glaesserella parasuis]MDG6409851.1 Holliday junction resolvase [Glaesserella parasuis]MDG6450261.1 Holliday junction resolvase [Glaesserella parasuis]MDO9791261.1 Holliday junction resolvase [Glaesserella parasuis]MDO9857944.1 Holliday junction resolvase [Glaesserella parasuis]